MDERRSGVDRRRGGRPAKSEQERLVSLTTNVLPEAYDRIVRRAQLRGEKPAEYVRALIMRDLARETPDPVSKLENTGPSTPLLG